MKLYENIAIVVLITWLFSGCAGFALIDPVEQENTSMQLQLVDIQNGQIYSLSDWTQDVCDSIGDGCTYSSQNLGNDSFAITATVRFSMTDTLENRSHSLALSFTQLVESSQSELIDSEGSFIFESPATLWNNFFLGNQWMSEDKFASVRFSGDIAEGVAHFGPGGNGSIWVNRANRFADENGKQWASLDGEFVASLFPELSAQSPQYSLENGRYFAVFPLE